LALVCHHPNPKEHPITWWGFSISAAWGILFSIPWGFLFSVPWPITLSTPWGFLFSFPWGIQLTISTNEIEDFVDISDMRADQFYEKFYLLLLDSDGVENANIPKTFIKSYLTLQHIYCLFFTFVY